MTDPRNDLTKLQDMLAASERAGDGYKDRKDAIKQRIAELERKSDV